MFLLTSLIPPLTVCMCMCTCTCTCTCALTACPQSLHHIQLQTCSFHISRPFSRDRNLHHLQTQKRDLSSCFYRAFLVSNCQKKVFTSISRSWSSIWWTDRCSEVNSWHWFSSFRLKHHFSWQTSSSSAADFSQFQLLTHLGFKPKAPAWLL